MSRLLGFVCLLVLLPLSRGFGADLTADQVREMLAVAPPNRPADLSGKSLEGLDLSGVDFKRASLARTNLFGAKLVGANLTGANLSGAKLDLSWIMRANFSDADLSGASLQGLVVSYGLEITPADAPIFTGANFADARILARFSQFDLRGANFARAQMGADMKNQSMGLMRTDLSSAKLARTNFAGADLSRALLRFADLTEANLAGAELFGADLSGADLTGTDLTGADAGEADFTGAVLKDARGLETIKGERIMGLERAGAR
jgi:uncharacterized protein YjbI with pentapeptide repeats